MIVISDASPIINLAIINCLELLPKIFGKIIVPQSVFEEITLRGAGMPGANEVQEADWIEIRKCSDDSLFRALRLQIDPGEAEAIVLALELPAELLLIDERLGRRIAKDFQINIMGLLGFLRVAKQKQLIKAVKPYLDKLINEAGFRVSQALYKEILESEAEK